MHFRERRTVDAKYHCKRGRERERKRGSVVGNRRSKVTRDSVVGF
jgi:hypothetical protein